MTRSIIHSGILGINARNLLYLRPFNKKNAVRLADNKLKTKLYLSTRGLPVAKLYGAIETKHQLRNYQWNTLPKSFVIKPNRGFGGDGIMIINNFDAKNEIQIQEIQDHIYNIMEGNYSLANAPDIAMLEQKIIPHPSLLDFCGEGLPDVRIIVHNCIPVMAMLRLPTPESEGKANLHAGGAIAGIDLATGEITHVFHKNRLVESLPFAKKPLRGFRIPRFDDMLMIALKAQLISNLGYLAIDIVLDKNEEPLVLELNARGGLGIQIANQAPLRERLDRIKGLKVQTPDKGVRIGKELFGSSIEREITQISGKTVVGLVEPVELLLRKEGTHLTIARIQPSRKNSIITQALAEKLKLSDNIHEGTDVPVDMILGNKRLKTKLHIQTFDDEHDIIIGQEDLKDFLVDPTKKHDYHKSYKVDLITPSTHSNYPDIDRKLAFIDEKISLLKYLRPSNILEEKEAFLRNPEAYNPQFEYPELEFDKEHFVTLLSEIQTDDTPLGKLFEKKKRELENMITLVSTSDPEEFTELSQKIYGTVDEKLLTLARERLENMPKEFKTNEAIFNADEAKGKFEQILKQYDLKNWKVVISERINSAASVGKSGKIFIRKDATFAESKILGTIAHEIETHVLTAENGKHQPYLLFNRGFGNYLLTQEGLAVYNQEEFTDSGSSNIKYYNTAANVLAVYYAQQFSFSECFHLLHQLPFSQDDIFRLVLKAKRGIRDTLQPGAFTKGIIYLKGREMIQDFASSGGDLTKLYVGKIALEDLDSIYQIPTLRTPRYIPLFLL